MATDEAVAELAKSVDTILAFDRPDLRERPDWGKFNFRDAERELQRIFTVVTQLKTLPLEVLPEDIATQINTHLIQAAKPLEQLDGFDIDADNPGGTHDVYSKSLVSSADQLYKQVTPWIPFLAYQKGDVERNIAALTNTVIEGKRIVDDAKEEIQARESEMVAIIEAAREASASAGAAVFTKQFEEESTNCSKSAKAWLIAAGSLSVGTLVAAGVSIWLNVADPPSNWLHAAPKFFVLAVFLTATLWSARMYKAFMHQAAVNRHRSLSLQTFQAFSAAANDDQTKNAVLLETTHSIFGSVSTGLLNEKPPADAGTRVVELVKSTASGE